MTPKAHSSIQVIARLSRLLDILAAHDEPLNLKTLAGAAGLHPSTAFRILASLIEHGLVERSANGRYRLGSKLLSLSSRVRGWPDHCRETHPMLERWGAASDEIASPGARQDASAAANATSGIRAADGRRDPANSFRHPRSDPAPDP